MPPGAPRLSPAVPSPTAAVSWRPANRWAPRGVRSGRQNLGADLLFIPLVIAVKPSGTRSIFGVTSQIRGGSRQIVLVSKASAFLNSIMVFSTAEHNSVPTAWQWIWPMPWKWPFPNELTWPVTSSVTSRSTQLCFARQICSGYQTPFEFWKLCYGLDPSQARVKMHLMHFISTTKKLVHVWLIFFASLALWSGERWCIAVYEYLCICK